MLVNCSSKCHLSILDSFHFSSYDFLQFQNFAALGYRKCDVQNMNENIIVTPFTYQRTLFKKVYERRETVISITAIVPISKTISGQHQSQSYGANANI